jgi:PAS domain S-box-containing protein
MVIVNADGEIQLANTVTERMFGYRHDELIGQPVETLIPVRYHQRHPDHRAGFFSASQARPMGVGLELWGQRKDGVEFPVEISLSPLETEQGLLATAAIRDVTERKRFETELRRRTLEAADQAELLELAHDAIFTRDRERVITYWNTGAEATYGYSKEEAVGKRPGDLLRTEYPIPLEEIERLVSEGGSWQGELVQHARDGSELIVESRWVARYDEEGRMAALLEINRDVTARVEAEAARQHLAAAAERERLQDELAQARRLESLGQLAGGVAHDFNNLLSVIENYAAFVAEELAAEPGDRWQSARDDLNELQQAAERAARLTKQLLAFAKRDVTRRDVVDLSEVVASLEQLLQRTLGEHIKLVITLAPDVRPVLADPGQLEQVVVNLAVNARDAMPGGGTLTIDTANVEVDDLYAASRPGLSPGPHVRLRVSDTGEGMPADVIERAFEPFFTTKPTGKGTGLGLATIYGIITGSGGRPALYSEPNVGTTFTALLPVTDKSPAAPEEALPALSGGAGETVLLVEDEEALRTAVQRILTRAGYKVIAADSGARAIELAAAHPEPIQLLLTDVIMPKMLGQEVAAGISKAHPSTKVLYMSGFAQPTLGESGQLPPGATLVEKPFTGPVLLDQVRQILDRG